MRNKGKKPKNLITVLRSVYFALFPHGTRRYQFTHTILRGLLIHFRPLNKRYQTWIKLYDRLDDEEIEKFKIRIESFSSKPLISILMPVYNPNIKHLILAIKSVQDQIYKKWELCIVDDASTNLKVQETILRFAEADQRVKPVFRQENGHISAASNSALSIASGKYSALLDHDDLLHPLALFWVVYTINQFPDCVVIYSDEDKIIDSGKRIEPYFKPDFDHELLLSQNMISHLGVYRTSTLLKIGGFRKGLEGSQDYDLMLRVLEVIDPKQVQHISRVLYHWRISKKSAATRVDVKPYAMKASIQALQNYLENQKIDAVVEPFQQYGYKVHYRIPDEQPTVEIVLLSDSNNRNSVNVLNNLLTKTAYEQISITLVNSVKPADKIISEVTDTRIKSLSVINLPEISYNQVFDLITSDMIVMISSFCKHFPSNWLENLIGLVCQEEIGLVSPQLLDLSGRIISSGIVFDHQKSARHIFNDVIKDGPDYYFGWASLDKGYCALPSGCLLVKRDHFLSVGGFNQSLSNHQTQVIDLCLKFKEKGLRNVMVPDVEVTLDLSKNDYPINGDIIQDPADRDYFTKRWKTFLERDPAFNPNLTLHKGKPTVLDKPRMTQYDRPA